MQGRLGLLPCVLSFSVNVKRNTVPELQATETTRLAGTADLLSSAGQPSGLRGGKAQARCAAGTPRSGSELPEATETTLGVLLTSQMHLKGDNRAL